MGLEDLLLLRWKCSPDWSMDSTQALSDLQLSLCRNRQTEIIWLQSDLYSQYASSITKVGSKYNEEVAHKMIVCPTYSLLSEPWR